MKKDIKTKILRVSGGEIYFQRITLHDGEVRWMLMQKDTSAIIPAYRDRKFSDMGVCYKNPSIPAYLEPVRPVPANFTTDTLSGYSPNKYADGHEPLKTLQFR
jgi:hypothetical protein